MKLILIGILLAAIGASRLQGTQSPQATANDLQPTIKVEILQPAGNDLQTTLTVDHLQ